MAVFYDFFGCVPLTPFRSFGLIESNRRTRSSPSNEQELSYRW